jgi:ABC-type transport system involved in multi-copper enzyme maturation permease subunit
MSTPTAPETREAAYRPFAAEAGLSEVRADVPTFARWVGGIGLMLVFFGTAVLIFNTFGPQRWLGPTFGQFCIIFGLPCLLYHAARDADPQIRRAYGGFGLIFAVTGVVVSLLPAQGVVGGLFLPWGFICFILSLVFLLAFSRHEDDPLWEKATFYTVGGIGAAAALAGLVGGSISTNFLVPYGLVLSFVGLFYLWATISLPATPAELRYRIGVALGVLGGVVALVALARCFVPGERYLVPAGLLLIGLGVLYAVIAVGLVSERQFIVLTRRELAAYFYSPIAYIVLFGITIVGWVMYAYFLLGLLSDVIGAGGARPEPIVREYIVSLVPVMCVIFVVPVLTMRLLSEERRTGTYEVLLTAPLGEVSVVLSKFFAALIYYLLLWVPWGLFLIELRVDGGKPFDYLPLLSFYGALVCSGAAFVAMGLFFSSLTRNQIIAAVMTFMGMMCLLIFFLLQQLNVGPTLAALFKQLSFIDLWITSLGGKLYIRDIVLQLSIAVFWLYLTVKVLEARKWS